MTAEDWARVFRAGTFAITSKSMQPGEALAAALDAMAKAILDLDEQAGEQP